MKIDTKVVKILVITLITFSSFVGVIAQTSHPNQVEVLEIIAPDEIVIFYMGDFNFVDASIDPIIFQYRISELNGNPVEVNLEFKMTATVPSLELNDEILYHVQTLPGEPLKWDGHPLTISNRIIDENTRNRGYINDNFGHRVNFGTETLAQISDADQKDLQDAVLKAGKLPAGKYTFFLNIWSSDPNTEVLSYEKTKIIDITNPTSLDLVGPGGSFSEGVEIFTLFPIFHWESQGCKYSIRVSEYDQAVHSSVEEALNSGANLPFPDDGSYYAGDDGEGLESTILQYPLSGAKQLEYGKTYVWSVKKACITTAGEDERNSDIYAFKIANITGEGDDSGVGVAGGVITDPVLSALQSILGDLFEGLFSGDGELAGYTTVAGILLNGETATAEAVGDLAEKLLSGDVGPIRIKIQ